MDGRASARRRRWLAALATSVAVFAAPASAQAAYNLTISTGPTISVSCSQGTCTATGSGANLSVTDLESELAAGDVTISTGSDGTEDGDINVLASISAASLSTLSFEPKAGGTVIVDAGDITTGGDQFYEGGVTLGASTDLQAPDVVFQGSLDGGFDLTVTGDASLGTVGGAAELGSLDVTGATTIDGPISTDGDQTYGGAVTLDSDATLDSTGGSGNITFDSTVDGAQKLTVETEGITEFAGAVGGSTPLTDLETINNGGATLEFGANVTLDGGNLQEPVELLGNVTLTIENNGSFTFNYGVTGDQQLTVDAADGGGIVYLGGYGDSFSGVVVDGGTLAFGSGALGSGPVTVNGGTLMWWAQVPPDDDPTIQGLSVGSNGGTLFTDSNDVTLSGGISGTGMLTTQTGAGSLTLAGPRGVNVTYGGGIDDQNGTLIVTGSTSTPITVGSGATLACVNGTLTGAITDDGGTLEGAPGAPTDVSATPGLGSAQVSFTPGAANCSPVSYTAAAAPGGAVSSASTNSPLSVGGLVAGTPYTFTVTATNPMGSTISSESSSIDVSAKAPSASIVTPSANATYKLGQIVKASYSCLDGTAGPGLSSCAGPVGSGAPIDTATTGKHIFMVKATSKDGQSVTASAAYTVVESPLTVRSGRATKSGAITLVLAVPYAGTVAVTAAQPRAPSVRKSVSVTSPQSLTVKLGWPKSKAGKLPRQVRLKIAYTPHGGYVESRDVTVRIP